MKFANLEYTILLSLIPAVILFLIWRFKVDQQDLNRLAELPILRKLLKNYHPIEKKLHIGLVLAGIFFLLLALLGPQWGFHWETITYSGLDIIVAVDTSKSMLAEDVKPSRLERAKLVISDLVDQLDGDRIGLITFAGTSFLQIPLTIDYNAFMQGVQSLDPAIMPQGGTAIGQAMENAIRAFSNVQSQNKMLLLITDGENHLSDPIKIAKEANQNGIQIMVLGLGTNNGELIPIILAGQRQYLKDDSGNVIKSKADEVLLKNIAQSANGIYVSANDLTSLDMLYASFINKLNMNKYKTMRQRKFHEQYQIFLIIGIFLLCAETLLGIKKGGSS